MFWARETRAVLPSTHPRAAWPVRPFKVSVGPDPALRAQVYPSKGDLEVGSLTDGPGPVAAWRMEYKPSVVLARSRSCPQTGPRTRPQKAVPPPQLQPATVLTVPWSPSPPLPVSSLHQLTSKSNSLMPPLGCFLDLSAPLQIRQKICPLSPFSQSRSRAPGLEGVRNTAPWFMNE